MAVQHEQGDIHLLGEDRIAIFIFGGVGCFLLVQPPLPLFAVERGVHGFDLAEDVFLRGAAVIPFVWSVA